MFSKKFKLCKIFTTKKKIVTFDSKLDTEPNKIETVSYIVETDLSGGSNFIQEHGQDKDVESLNTVDHFYCCGNIMKLIADIFSNLKIKEDIAIVEQVIEIIDPALIPEITALNVVLNKIETVSSVKK